MATNPIPKAKRVRRDNVEDQEQLRAQILAAAAEIYRGGGPQALTMRAVGAAVGVSAMALYRYFPGKAELEHGLWDFVMQEVHQEVGRAMEGQASALGQLRATTEAALRYWEEHPDHFRLVFMTEQTPSPGRSPGVTSLPSYIRAVELSRKMIEALAEELGGDRSRVLVARDMRMTMMLGYLHARLINIRYPWGDFGALRAQVIDGVVEAVLACLRVGSVPARNAQALDRARG